MTTYFDKIEKISFEGEKSTNPFAFKHYDANQVILGKTMAEHYAWRCVIGIPFAGMGMICLG